MRHKQKINLICCFLWSGGIFPENSEHLVNAFQNAAQYVNRFSEKLGLQPIVRTVDISDSFEVQKTGLWMEKKMMNKVRQKIYKCERIKLKFIAIFTVCNMIEEQKVGAIFGPNSPKTAGKKIRSKCLNSISSQNWFSF